MSAGAPLPVLIVGGGIGGLAAAYALARRNIASVVLEQASRFAEIGAGIQIGPNVFRVLETLGLRDAVSETAVFIDHLIMMDSVSGAEITRIALKGAFEKRYGYPYAVIHRADLHKVFLQACQDHDLITLETGKQVTDFQDQSDGVALQTADGGHYQGVALIGADGLWSQIRGQLLDDWKPIVSGHIAYRAVLPIAQIPEELRLNAACLWAGPRHHLVHYPLRNWELFNLVAVFHSDKYVEGWNEPGDRDELLRRFEAAGPIPKKLIDLVPDWRMWVLCDRDPIKVWSRGNVTLLGDAAHPMLQYFAQGACMAVEDAVNLAGHAAVAAQSGGDYATAFQAYQSERYKRTGRVQLTARFLGDIYHAQGVHAELRNDLLGAPSEGPPEGLSWLYDGPP